MAKHAKKIGGMVRKALLGERLSILDTFSTEMLVRGLKRKGVVIAVLQINADVRAYYGTEEEVIEWACGVINQNTKWTTFTIDDIRTAEKYHDEEHPLIVFDVWHFDVTSQELYL